MRRPLAVVVLLALLSGAACQDGGSVTSADERPERGERAGQPRDERVNGRDGAAVECPQTGPDAGGGSALELADVTEEAALVEPLLGMYGHAVATGDVEGDGWLDLFVGTFGDRPEDRYQERGATGPAPDRLLLGGADGFTEAPGFPELRGRSSGAVFADLDGDGDLDLVVVRNAEEGASEEARSVVLRNEGGQLVVDARPPPVVGGRGVGVLDYDGDGRLDLFIAADRFSEGSSVLLRGGDDGELTDVTDEAGLPDGLQGFGVAAADLTSDGRPDLFVAGSNRLFVNLGDGSFREVESSIFATEPYGNEDDITGVAVGDANGDGRPDLVLGPHYNSTIDRGCVVAARLYLHRGMDGDAPVFEDVTAAAGLAGFATKAPHVELADFDADGLLDLLATASVGDGSRPAVLRNEGVGDDGVPRFSAPVGPGTDRYWVTAVTGDFDRDGRLDAFVVDPDPAFPSLLLHNAEPGDGWLQVDVPSDARGVGAVIEVYRAGEAGDDGALLARREVVLGQGYGAGGPASVHVGLGDVSRVDVVVRPSWDQEPVAALDVEADQRLRFPADFSDDAG